MSVKSRCAGALEPKNACDFYDPRGLSSATDEDIINYVRTHSILRLIELLPETTKKSVWWYLDCGDDDGLSIENSKVHIMIKQKGIPHEFRIRNGGHNWTFWREDLPDVLEFISQGFHN